MCVDLGNEGPEADETGGIIRGVRKVGEFYAQPVLTAVGSYAVAPAPLQEVKLRCTECTTATRMIICDAHADDRFSPLVPMANIEPGQEYPLEVRVVSFDPSHTESRV